jgi:hypothetical protein
MKEHVRTAVAYIAARLIGGSQSSSIYSYSTGKYTQFSGTLNTDSVSIYDYERGCYISGSSQNMYHYGDSHAITLSVMGSQFQGFDYGTSTHFSGTVNYGSVSLFDYEEGKHFQFSS